MVLLTVSGHTHVQVAAGSHGEVVMWDAEAVKLSPRREVWPGGVPSPPPA